MRRIFGPVAYPYAPVEKEQYIVDKRAELKLGTK